MYQKLFKVKKSGHHLQDCYANIYGLLTQLELYNPYIIDLTNQHRCREELVVAIFLGGLDTLISSQIWWFILRESCLLTLTTTFSFDLQVSTGTPLLPSLAPPPLHHLTLRHFYLPIPRERGTTQMVAEGTVEGVVKGMVEGMIATHSLHVSIVNRLIIILIVVGRSLANLIGLPILSLLMLLPLHPRVWWLYLGRTTIVLWSFRRHLKSFPLTHRIKHPPLARVLPYLPLRPTLWSLTQGYLPICQAQSLLTRFSKLSRPCYISIADGHACPIVGHGEANPTSSLQLSQVLYVPNFLVNLLSISAITKALFCSISFFPYHHTFQDLWTGKRIGLGHETARGLYGLLLDHLPVGLSCLLSSTNFAL